MITPLAYIIIIVVVALVAIYWFIKSAILSEYIRRIEDK